MKRLLPLIRIMTLKIYGVTPCLSKISYRFKKNTISVLIQSMSYKVRERTLCPWCGFILKKIAEEKWEECCLQDAWVDAINMISVLPNCHRWLRCSLENCSSVMLFIAHFSAKAVKLNGKYPSMESSGTPPSRRFVATRDSRQPWIDGHTLLGVSARSIEERKRNENRRNPQKGY